MGCCFENIEHCSQRVLLWDIFNILVLKSRLTAAPISLFSHTHQVKSLQAVEGTTPVGLGHRFAAVWQTTLGHPLGIESSILHDVWTTIFSREQHQIHTPLPPLLASQQHQ